MANRLVLPSLSTARALMPPMDGAQRVVNANGITPDIVAAVLACHESHWQQAERLAKALQGPTELQTIQNIWAFVRKRIRYELDADGQQLIKTPAAVVHIGVADCKGYSILTNALLRCLGIQGAFRFAAYTPLGPVTHVYSLAQVRGAWYVLDSCLPAFNQEKPFDQKEDHMTKIMMISGIGSDTEDTLGGLASITGFESVGELDIKLGYLGAVAERDAAVSVMGIGDPAVGAFDEAVGDFAAAVAALGNPDELERLGDAVLGRARRKGASHYTRYFRRMQAQGKKPMSIAQWRQKFPHLRGADDELGDVDEVGRVSHYTRYFRRMVARGRKPMSIAQWRQKYPHLRGPEDELGNAGDFVEGPYDELGDIGRRGRKQRKAKRKAKRGRRRERRKRRGSLFKRVARGAKRAAGKGLRAFARGLTAPARAVLEVTLPKAAPGFLYLFITNQGTLAKLPRKMQRKRRKQEKMARFIIKTLMMKESHFMAIIRRGIVRRYKRTPEQVLAARLSSYGPIAGLGNPAAMAMMGPLSEILSALSKIFGRKPKEDERMTADDVPDLESDLEEMPERDRREVQVHLDNKPASERYEPDGPADVQTEARDRQREARATQRVRNEPDGTPRNAELPSGEPEGDGGEDFKGGAASQAPAPSRGGAPGGGAGGDDPEESDDAPTATRSAKRAAGGGDDDQDDPPTGGGSIPKPVLYGGLGLAAWMFLGKGGKR